MPPTGAKSASGLVLGWGDGSPSNSGGGMSGPAIPWTGDRGKPDTSRPSAEHKRL